MTRTIGQALRKAAMRYPEAEEGIACKGTAIECSVYKAKKNSFLFVGDREIRLKLKVKLGTHEPPPLDLPEQWIDESYRAVADKRLVAMLPERRKGNR
jgi:hypothetical protein